MSGTEEQGEQVEEQCHAVGRRCEVVRENGEPCRGTPALGETFCHAHARYREATGRTALSVPLIEDEASITLVRSQAVRAMALGLIPPENGHAMLQGCRDAERRLDRRLAVQNAAMRYAALADKLGVEKLDGLMAKFVGRVKEERSAFGDQRSEEKPAASGQQPENDGQRSVIRENEQPAASGQMPESSDRGAASSGTAAGSGERPMRWQMDESWWQWQERCKAREAAARSAESREPAAGVREGELAAASTQLPENEQPDAIGEPEVVTHRSVFPGMKEQWDRALVRTEGKIAGVVGPRQGENGRDFVARKQEREAAIAAAG